MITDAPDVVEDVTEEVATEVFGGSSVLVAERRGRTVLVLREVNPPRIEMLAHVRNGRTYRVPYKAGFEVEDRWLSTADPDVSAVHRVQGNEYSYWCKKVVKPVLDGKKSLFDVFQLFP